MFNKLSFLPIESVHPVCLAIDDEDCENSNVAQIKHPAPISDVVGTKDVIEERHYLDKWLAKLWTGTLDEAGEKNLLVRVQDITDYPKEIPCELIANIYHTMGVDENEAKSLKTQISLQVVSDDNMPYRNSKPDCSYNQTKFPTEYYGYYDSYNAEIVLCPERISKTPEVLLKHHCNLTSRELYVVVLVHALAHALMDPTNAEGKSNKYQPLINVKNGFTEREVLMEESLANMLTLQYVDKLGKPEVVRYGEVREFIELQSPSYSFGLDQYDILKPDWKAWPKAKKNNKFIKDKEN